MQSPPDGSHAWEALDGDDGSLFFRPEPPPPQPPPSSSSSEDVNACAAPAAVEGVRRPHSSLLRRTTRRSGAPRQSLLPALPPPEDNDSQDQQGALRQASFLGLFPLQAETETQASAEADDLEDASPALCRLRHRLATTPLVGRSRSLTLLRDVLDAAHQGDNERTSALVVVRGSPGVGKTRLIREALSSAGGVVVSASGRGDPLRPPIPYGPLVRALGSYACHRAGSTSERHNRRLTLLRALGAEVDVLIRTVPDFRDLLFPSSDDDGNDQLQEGTVTTEFEEVEAAPKSKTSVPASTTAAVRVSPDAAHRFPFVFRSLMHGICQLHPLVLWLDDAHWIDVPTLRLVATLLQGTMKDPPVAGLVVVLALDPNATDPTTNAWFDSLASDLALNSAGKDFTAAASLPIAVHRIDLGPLQETDTRDLVAHALELDALDRFSRLGAVLHEWAGGVPAAVHDAIRHLHNVECLESDPDDPGQWSWDVDRAECLLRQHTPQELLSARLLGLPESVLGILQVAACLGPDIDPDLLELVRPGRITGALRVAEAHGLVLQDSDGDGLVFEREQVQRALYNLLPEDDRESLHCHIARLIWNELDEDGVDRHLFTVLAQLHAGRRRLEHYPTREAVAALCLHGGTRAALSSDFATASLYLDLGIDLLGERGWTDSYDWMVALHNAGAEMALCTSDLDRMEALLDQVLGRARSVLDRVPAWATQIHSRCLSGQYPSALEVGIKALRQLGESFPSNVSVLRVAVLYARLRRRLERLSNEQILRMTPITDKTVLARLNILHQIGAAVVNAKPHCLPFILMKMMSLTLTHGLSSFAPFAFVTFGAMCLSFRGDSDAGYRYGQLGLTLLDRLGHAEFLPRVYSVYYGFLHVWKRPLVEALGPLRQGFEVGLRTGDLEGAFNCGHIYCITSVDSGVPLPVARQDYQRLCQVIESSPQHMGMLSHTFPARQAIYDLIGLPSPDSVDVETSLAAAKRDGQSVAVHAIQSARMQVLYVFNDFDQADRYKMRLSQLRLIPPVFSRCLVAYFIGLLALANAQRGRQRRSNLREARQVIHYLQRLCLSCPESLLDKVAHLQAEVASTIGRSAEAHERFASAVALAQYWGTPFSRALIWERWGRHRLRAEGDEGVAGASACWQEACEHYEDLGAAAKAAALHRELDALTA